MIYIDTGALIARYIAKDDYHTEAKSSWKALEKNKDRLFTSNFVLDETFTLLGRRAGYKFAAERARAIYSSEALTILRPDKSNELEALRFFEKYSDQMVSYTDCISFALMREHKIKRVFTFDKHFDLAGFQIIP
jgi:uncharacterized protein